VAQDGLIYNIDRLHSIEQALPTEEERHAEEALTCEAQDLMKPDQFFRYFLAFDDLVPRIRCSIAMLQLPTNYAAVLRWFQQMQDACDILERPNFRHAILATMSVVNVVNGGRDQGGARGITLKAANKVAVQAAFDHKTTVLHFTVKLMRKYYGSEVDLHAAMYEAIHQASRIDVAAMAQTVDEMEAQLQSLKDALQPSPDGIPLIDNINVNDVFHPQAAKFICQWNPKLKDARRKLEHVMQTVKRMISFLHWDTDDSKALFKAIETFVLSYNVSYNELKKADDLAQRRERAAQERRRKQEEKLQANRQGTQGKLAMLQHTKSSLTTLHETVVLEEKEECPNHVQQHRLSDNVLGHPLMIQSRPVNIIEFQRTKDDTEIKPKGPKIQPATNLRASTSW